MPMDSTGVTPCPHCAGQGISAWAKRGSSREHPATCDLCRRLSHVLSSTSSGIPVASFFIALAFFLIGAVANLMVLGLTGIPVAVAYNLWAWKKAELWPISGESSKASRRGGWIVNTLAVLSIFLS
jgi:hypothetical protein